MMGIAKAESGKLYLCEQQYVNGAWIWQWYGDHTFPVELPQFMREPTVGNALPLSPGTYEYDFAAQNGHKNIGAWIDLAATEAGR
jgi:hypothetical protein